MIYLDYASSTPIDTAVLDLFYDISKKYYAKCIENVKTWWIYCVFNMYIF